MAERVNILGVAVDAVTMPEAVAAVEYYMDARAGVTVATANAEMIMRATKDAALRAVLAAAALVVPDGAGTVWAARHLGHAMPERVAGYDLVQELLRRAPATHRRVYFFGAAPGVAEKAKAKAEQLYPGIKIVGVRDGFGARRSRRHRRRRHTRRYGGRHEARAALDAKGKARMALPRNAPAEACGQTARPAEIRPEGTRRAKMRAALVDKE